MLANFVTKFAEGLQVESGKELYAVMEDQNGIWELHIDGAINCRGGGAGLVLTNLQGQTLERSIHFNFKVTNNEAEYEALIAGLGLALELGVRNMIVNIDSQLIIHQFYGEFQVKEPRMLPYLKLEKELATKFNCLEVTHTPRGSNL